MATSDKHSLPRLRQAGLALMLAALLVPLGACSETPTRPSLGQYMDDTAITTRVKTALAGSPRVKVGDVSVETFKGIVQLSGFVNSAEEKSEAERVARGVPGVKSVENDIRIK